MIHEIDLLNYEQLEYINNQFEHLKFDDGRISNRVVTKICKTVFDGPGCLELNNYCHDIIIDTKIPVPISKISQVYFVKYDTGGEYQDHYDHNPCGGVRPDYSMTCFLSDDYGDGELVITTKDGEFPVKLSKGKAVIYPGNLLHRVNKITSGRRDVFVCWFES